MCIIDKCANISIHVCKNSFCEQVSEKIQVKVLDNGIWRKLGQRFVWIESELN